MKTTNYYDTFIEVAEDCPVTAAEIPEARAGKETAASIQFRLIQDKPYHYTSDDILFQVYAEKNQLASAALASERQAFFSKSQACLRASPLPKRYGWGIHHDEHGKIAIYAVESEQYRALLKDPGLRHVKAMRSSRA